MIFCIKIISLGENMLLLLHFEGIDLRMALDAALNRAC